MPTERVQRQIDGLLDEAEAAAKRGDWEMVRARADAVLAYDPENADAGLHLAAAVRRLKGPPPGPAGSGEPSSPPASSPGPARPAQPSSLGNGRYQVKKFLGEGGKKKVFLAHDTVLDRDVAFALIKTEGLDLTSRQRVTREAQVMGRLGDHPNLMPIFDLGSEGDQPFMVLPLMPGGDVEGLIEKAPEHRLKLERAVEIGMAICRGLQFAHGRGVVHRDLKPGNVWLTEDGTAKIGDWGLALPVEQSRLTAHGMMVGTVAYMPPEQALGGEITPRADLYSFGCMLYEMVTGRPPFLGDDHVAIIGQHINTPAVAPSWHRADCPRPLEALVMRLLAKDPAQRPDSAKDVLAALEAIDLGSASAPATPKRAADGSESGSLDSLAGGVFVGRQKETGELRAALEEALSGHGRLVMLVGEPGIGKTRTALELTTYAGLRRCQVLWGRCYESQGAPPYWPWVQAVRGYVRTREPHQIRNEMGSGAPEIAGIVTDLRQRLPDLPQPSTIEGAEQARFRLFDAFAAFLRTASAAQPIVLVLDDLHWADKGTLLLLEFVARELAGTRVLVIGNYRDVDLSRQHPLSETLGELNRDRLFSRILLRGLTQDDVAKFIDLTSGAKSPPELARAVHVQTEGNPLFVTEVVRLLVQEGHLAPDRLSAAGKDRKVTTWTVRIPEGVREVIGRRLNRLSARCNETLTVAAVIGREFTLKQVGAAIDGQTEEMLLSVIEEALAARVVEEITSMVGRYQFTHALIQETLVNELSLGRRVRLHARIAEGLERTYGPEADAHAAELAFHFAAAESALGSAKLLTYSILAGERALAAYSYEEALQHLERAVASWQGPKSGLKIASIYASLARVHLGLGDGKGTETLALAYRTYRDAGDVDSALRLLESPHNVMVAFHLTPLLEEGLSLAQKSSSQAAALNASYGLGVGVTATGLDRAEQAFTDAMEFALRGGRDELAMQVHAARANVLGCHSKWTECLAASEAALRLAPTVKDTVSEVRALLWAAQSLTALGRPAEADKRNTEMLAIADRARDHTWRARTYLTGCQLHMSLGDWIAAEEDVRNHARVTGTPDGSSILNMVTHAMSALHRGDKQASLKLLAETDRAVRNEAPGSWLLMGPVAALAQVAYQYRLESQFETFQAWADTIESKARHMATDIRDARTVRAFGAVLHGDAELARKLLPLMPPDGGIISVVSIDHLRALLALTSGDLSQVSALFEKAIQTLRAAGYRPLLAWALFDYAEFLAGRGKDGDRDRAVALWDESMLLARSLGMQPLTERVIARKKILKA